MGTSLKNSEMSESAPLTQWLRQFSYSEGCIYTEEKILIEIKFQPFLGKNEKLNSNFEGYCETSKIIAVQGKKYERAMVAKKSKVELKWYANCHDTSVKKINGIFFIFLVLCG